MLRATRATSSRRRRAPALPEELVVWEILVRLPAKALLRCRAVCRSWRRLTSAADFLLAHRRRQPSLPLVWFDGPTHRNVVNLAIDAFDLGAPAGAERRPVLCFNGQHGRSWGFEIHASCDGLLLLSLASSGFYICNPATREWTTLPSLTGANVSVLGMYLHGSSGEYRVLYCKCTRMNGNASYYVLTVGSPAEPRCIGLPPASPSVKKYIASGMRFFSTPESVLSVLLRGSLHWIPHLQKRKVLVVFDTVSESFRSICSPVARSGPVHDPYLLETDGVLGICWVNKHQRQRKKTMKLCVLQDYESETWSLKYEIQLPEAEMGVFVETRFFGTVVPENGDVLLTELDSFPLFHCNSKEKLVQKFQWDGIFTGHWFKESLVRHAFFQRQDAADVGQPCFFQGL